MKAGARGEVGGGLVETRGATVMTGAWVARLPLRRQDEEVSSGPADDLLSQVTESPE